MGCPIQFVGWKSWWEQVQHSMDMLWRLIFIGMIRSILSKFINTADTLEFKYSTELFSMCHYYITSSFARSFTFFIIFEKNRRFFNILQWSNYLITFTTSISGHRIIIMKQRPWVCSDSGSHVQNQVQTSECQIRRYQQLHWRDTSSSLGCYRIKDLGVIRVVS